MALNLDGAARVVETFMEDTCRVTRNQNTYKRGTLDEESLKLTPAAPSLIYEGICFATPAGLQARTDDVAGNAASQKTFNLGIPREAVELRPGDDVEILTSKRDPQLDGNKFKVKDVAVTTFLVYRLCTITGLETSKGS